MVPSLAGPKRPQDRINLPDVKKNFLDDAERGAEDRRDRDQRIEVHHSGRQRGDRRHHQLHQHFEPVGDDRRRSAREESRGARPENQALGEDQPRARIESCDGLSGRRRAYCRIWKSCKFNLVGYGCTTCIGNSGPLPEAVAEAVQKGKLTVAAVLSGNRNFEGRINPLVRANYLASPPLVVAYALAGRVDIDLATRSARSDPNGQNVFLRDIWPSIRRSAGRGEDDRCAARCSHKQYSEVFQGDEHWNSVKVPAGDLL